MSDPLVTRLRNEKLTGALAFEAADRIEADAENRAHMNDLVDRNLVDAETARARIAELEGERDQARRIAVRLLDAAEVVSEWAMATDEMPDDVYDRLLDGMEDIDAEEGGIMLDLSHWG